MITPLQSGVFRQGAAFRGVTDQLNCPKARGCFFIAAVLDRSVLDRPKGSLRHLPTAATRSKASSFARRSPPVIGCPAGYNADVGAGFIWKLATPGDRIFDTTRTGIVGGSRHSEI